MENHTQNNLNPIDSGLMKLIKSLYEQVLVKKDVELVKSYSLAKSNFCIDLDRELMEKGLDPVQKELTLEWYELHGNDPWSSGVEPNEEAQKYIKLRIAEFVNKFADDHRLEL